MILYAPIRRQISREIANHHHFERQRYRKSRRLKDSSWLMSISSLVFSITVKVYLLLEIAFITIRDTDDARDASEIQKEVERTLLPLTVEVLAFTSLGST